MKERLEKSGLRIMLCCFLALYMLLALCMDVSPTEASDQKSLMQAALEVFARPQSYILFVLLVMLSGVALKWGISCVSQFVWAGLPAVFLAACTCVGRAFIEPDWGNLVISLKWIRIQKWLFCFPGWFFLGFAAMIVLYHLLDRIAEKHGMRHRTEKSAWIRVFEVHPFAAPLLVLLVCYIPVFILSWPGIVVPGDTISQIVQFYGGIPRGQTLIYENSTWNNHHPVLHTFLLDLFLELGSRYMNSASVGLGLFVCVQVLLTACVLAFAICEMQKEGVPPGVCIFLAIFFGLHPRIQNLLTMVSKDILYANALVLLGIVVVRLMKEHSGTKWILPITCLGMMLLRNEGIYILLAMLMMVCIAMPKKRRIALIALAGSVVFWIIWNNAVFPALHISPGSRREMFSVPFQQTGRYVANFGDAVTEEERAIIDAVLEYDRIAELYKPDISDGVKDLYRPTATGEDLVSYFKVWAQMFVKRPMTYVEAVLENKNLYFYPSISKIGLEDTAHHYWTSELDMYVISQECQTYGIEISYPVQLEKVRNTYEEIREGIFSLPGFWLLTQNAPYVWVIVISLCYALYRRKIHTLLLMMPIVLQLIVIFLGPLDGSSFRYMYPVVLYLPLPLMSALYMKPGK